MRSIGTDQDKHFPLALTPRERKGLQFEAYISRKLENLTIPYQRQSSYADFLLPYNIQLEAKFTHARVYPSWIKRDWISRFTPEATLKLVIANRGIKLTEEGKQLLKENSIYLIFFDEIYKLKNLYEWLRFLFGEGRVTRFIEPYNMDSKIGNVVFVYSSYNNINYYCNKPLTAISETGKMGKLSGESIDVSVKPIRFAVFSVRKLLSSLKHGISKLSCRCKKLRLPTHFLFGLERKNRIPERIWSSLAKKR